MFNVLGQGYPGMFVLFPDRDRGCRKSWVCERTHWDENHFFLRFQLPVKDRAAVRAEMEGRLLSAFIVDPNILRG